MSKVSKYMVKKNQRPLVKFRTNKNSHYVIRGGKKVVVNDVVNNIYQECCKTRKRRKKNLARKAIKKNQVTTEEMLDYMYPSIRGFQFGDNAAINNAVRNQQMEFLRQRAQNYRNQQEYFQQNGLDARLRDLQEQQRRQEFVQQVQYGNLLRNIDLQFERARRDIGLQEPEFGARQRPRREMDPDEPIIRGPAPEEQKDMYEDFLGNLIGQQEVEQPQENQQLVRAQDTENVRRVIQQLQMRQLLRQPVQIVNVPRNEIQQFLAQQQQNEQIQANQQEQIQQPQIIQQEEIQQEEEQKEEQKDVVDVLQQQKEELKNKFLQIEQHYQELSEVADQDEKLRLEKIKQNTMNRLKLLNKQKNIVFDEEELNIKTPEIQYLQQQDQLQEQIFENTLLQRIPPQQQEEPSLLKFWLRQNPIQNTRKQKENQESFESEKTSSEGMSKEDKQTDIDKYFSEARKSQGDDSGSADEKKKQEEKNVIIKEKLRIKQEKEKIQAYINEIQKQGKLTKESEQRIVMKQNKIIISIIEGLIKKLTIYNLPEDLQRDLEEAQNAVKQAERELQIFSKDQQEQIAYAISAFQNEVRKLQQMEAVLNKRKEQMKDKKYQISQGSFNKFELEMNKMYLDSVNKLKENIPEQSRDRILGEMKINRENLDQVIQRIETLKEQTLDKKELDRIEKEMQKQDENNFTRKILLKKDFPTFSYVKFATSETTIPFMPNPDYHKIQRSLRRDGGAFWLFELLNGGGRTPKYLKGELDKDIQILQGKLKKDHVFSEGQKELIQYLYFIKEQARHQIENSETFVEKNIMKKKMYQDFFLKPQQELDMMRTFIKKFNIDLYVVLNSFGDLEISKQEAERYKNLILTFDDVQVQEGETRKQKTEKRDQRLHEIQKQPLINFIYYVLFTLKQLTFQKKKDFETSGESSDGKGFAKNKKGVYGFEMDTFLKQEQENGEYLGLTNLKNLSDFLPKITPDKDTFIVILDNNHYTTLFIDTEMKNIVYYDSFGKLPPKEISDFVSEIHKHLVKKGEEVHYRFKYNLQENQPQSDPNCSMYVLDFIDKYQDTKNFVYATKFKNPKEIHEKRQAVFPYI